MKLLELTRVEMRRALTRRIVRWMLLIAVVGCGVVGLFAFLTSADAVELARDPSHPAHMQNWWDADADDPLLLIAAVYLVIGTAICGASVGGAEWKFGTVTTVLTWQPVRTRFHTARTLSAAALAFVISFGLQVLFLAGTLPAVFAHGSTDGIDAAWWGSLGLAMVRISAMSALVAVLALNVAMIGRSTTVALVVLAGWALAVEGTIRGLRPSLGRYLVSENVGTFVPWRGLEDAEFELGPAVALATLGLYAAVVVAIATVLFVRRDVTGAT